MTPATTLWGALLGLTLGVGLIVLWTGLPVNRQVALDQRIEPYLDRAPRRSRLLALDDPRPWRLSDLAAPLTRRLATALDRVLGGTDSVRTRQQRAGLPPDVEGFRVQQALWGVLTATLALAAGTVLWWARGASVVALGVLVGVPSSPASCCATCSSPGPPRSGRRRSWLSSPRSPSCWPCR